MKKSILITIVVLTIVATNLKAQVSFYNSDSTATADFYIGYLGGTGVDKELAYEWFGSVRAGASLRWNLTKKLYVRGFGIVDTYKWGDTGVSAFGMTFLSYSPTKWLTIQGGNLPSSTAANFRPYPVSSSGQFEFISQSLLPGSDLGVKTIINAGKLSLEANVMKREDVAEYQFVLGNSVYKGGLFYSTNKYGGVIKYEKNNFYLLLTDYIDNSDSDSFNKLGITLFWTFNEEKGLSILGDFDFTDTTAEWAELGVGKSASFGKFNGFFAISAMYSQTIPSQLRLTFMVNL